MPSTLWQACPNLERLVASHNQLRSLPQLSRLPALARLDLSHNRLSDVTALAGCGTLLHFLPTSYILHLTSLTSHLSPSYLLLLLPALYG